MPIDIEHFRARVLQDALTEATATYWLRRAQDFERVAEGVEEESEQTVWPAAFHRKAVLARRGMRMLGGLTLGRSRSACRAEFTVASRRSFPESTSRPNPIPLRRLRTRRSSAGRSG